MESRECWKCVTYSKCEIFDRINGVSIEFQKKYFRLNEMAILCSNYEFDKKRSEKQ